MSPADKLIPRLPWSKKTGPGRWIARCPAHKDRSPSVTITEKEDGTILLYCHAECDVGDVVGAVGLELHDLYPPKPKGDYRAPDRNALNAADILTASADELVFAYIAMSDLQRWLADETQGQPPGPHTRSRFLTATRRIQAAAERATGRHIEADAERRAIIAAAVLTPEEELDLREWANA